jgi:hypothetical protein
MSDWPAREWLEAEAERRRLTPGAILDEVIAGRVPFPRDHPEAPKFWMDEIGGALQEIVPAFLMEEPLTQEEIDLMRAYLWQWVKSPVWAPSGCLESLRLQVAAITSREDIDRAIGAAVDLGMDPL